MLVACSHDPILGNVAELIWNEVNDDGCWRRSCHGLYPAQDSYLLCNPSTRVSLGTYSNAPINTAINNIAKASPLSRDEVLHSLNSPSLSTTYILRQRFQEAQFSHALYCHRKKYRQALNTSSSNFIPFPSESEIVFHSLLHSLCCDKRSCTAALVLKSVTSSRLSKKLNIKRLLINNNEQHAGPFNNRVLCTLGSFFRF